MPASRLPKDAYDAVLKYQGGGCAICGAPPPDTRRLNADHDHVTGVFRGLLCTYDNRYVVGRHRDWEILSIAADYLRYPPALACGIDINLGAGPVTRKRRRRRTRRP